jgi:hypothetical protein
MWLFRFRDLRETREERFRNTTDHASEPRCGASGALTLRDVTSSPRGNKLGWTILPRTVAQDYVLLDHGINKKVQ